MSTPLYVEIDEELKRRAKGQPEYRMELDDKRSPADWTGELEQVFGDEPETAEPKRDHLVKAIAILHAWVETIDRR